ncbi:MAG: OB-fold domain-containing protein, partial [Thermoplasmata archaeon]|nr:OB-fold domain-containing protein [Thermoplasmata archaeon]
TREVEWIDLPRTGRLYAFSAVLVGAPLGMESEVPYVVGLVDLEGSPLRLFGRIVGTPWNECRVGQPVEV